MELHDLDLGLPRFLETHLCIVLKERLSSKLFEATGSELIALWPVLNTRMNLLRSRFVPIAGNSLDGLWRSTTHSSRLEDVLPALNDSVTRTFNSLDLHRLLPHGDGLYEKLFPRAFKIRATLLKDATLLRFTVQHPLCDAKGLYKIVKAYCELLAGKTGDNIPSQDFERHLELKSEPMSEKALPPEPPSDSIALRHQSSIVQGWPAVILSIWKQCLSRIKGPVRKDMTFLMPNEVIERLAKTAKDAGVRVSRHDLLMAMIYNVAMDSSKWRGRSPQFAFIMNISKFFTFTPILHNPWILVPMSSEEPVRAFKAAIYDTASRLRSTIEEARQPHVIGQIVKQHRLVKSEPIRTLHYASHEPDIILTSWAQQPLFDLEFPSGNEQRAIKPIYLQCSVNPCPVNLGGLTWDNGVVTWSSKDGFWIQGNLDEKIWDRLVDLRDTHRTSPGS